MFMWDHVAPGQEFPDLAGYFYRPVIDLSKRAPGTGAHAPIRKADDDITEQSERRQNRFVFFLALSLLP
jgi:hypothetical protein